MQHASINIERVGKRVKRVKRNSDRQENVEVWRLIDDPDAREQPLEILKEKIPVFEKTEHAQIHAHAGDKPSLLAMSILRFADLAAEPEIHCRGGKKKRRKRRVPRAVKNVTGNDEQVFSHFPPTNAPIEGDDDYEENDERQ